MEILGKKRSKELEAMYAGIVRNMEKYKDNRTVSAFLLANKLGLEELLTQHDNNTKVIFYNLGGLPELYLAMGDSGYPKCSVEKLNAIQALAGDSLINHDLIDFSEAQGLSNEVCSTDKAAMGYLLKGLLPEPVCTVFVNAPCDSQLVGAETIKELTGKDVFLIDIPDKHGENEINYVAAQLMDEIKFLEKNTGTKLNWDRLKEICEENNRMVENLLQWLEARKAVPCPQSAKVMDSVYIMLNDGSGNPGATWMAGEFAEDARENAAKGIGAAKNGEKIRALWFGAPVWFDTSIYDWMEDELGMVIPISMFSYIVPEMFIDTSTRETMIHDLARKQLFMPMGRHFSGAMNYFIDDVIRAIDDYKCDCVVLAAHMACKHAYGIFGHLQERLREIDIPMLTIPFDLFDARVTSLEKMKGEFRRFAEDVMYPRLEK